MYTLLYLLFLVELGLGCCMRAFSLVVGTRGYFSSCRARASHRGSFSCGRAQTLDALASVVAAGVLVVVIQSLSCV